MDHLGDGNPHDRLPSALGLDMAAAHLGAWVDARVLIVGTGAYTSDAPSACRALTLAYARSSNPIGK